MKISHHADDATIIAYAAGALTEGFSLVLAGHLEYCPSCRERLAEAQALGGALLFNQQSAEPPAGGLEDLWMRIDAATDEEPMPSAAATAYDEVLPQAVLSLLAGGSESIPWRRLAPGISHYLFETVDSDEGSVRLLSIAPGVTIPQHTHRGGELTLVLNGAYRDEIGLFQRGDLSDLDPSVSHQPVAGREEPCICLIATDRPLRFSGVVNRMLQPIFGL